MKMTCRWLKAAVVTPSGCTFRKGGVGPEMMIRHWGPDTDIPVHSHPYHEMFYVLEGEIEISGITYSAGACIYIEKDTPYGPTRAPRAVKCCAMPRPVSENSWQMSMDAYIEADGLKTFYVKAGSGFPVVLFHGAAPGASAQVNWQLNIEPLAAAGLPSTPMISPGSAAPRIQPIFPSSIA